jgi:hypothetical protein
MRRKPPSAPTNPNNVQKDTKRNSMDHAAMNRSSPLRILVTTPSAHPPIGHALFTIVVPRCSSILMLYADTLEAATVIGMNCSCDSRAGFDLAGAPERTETSGCS